MRRDPAQPHPRIVDLTQVSEVGVAHGHVSCPEPGKAELLGAAGKTGLIAHAGLVPLEGLDWEEHSER